jgi:two-component system chemotaxis response regulator CheY
MVYLKRKVNPLRILVIDDYQPHGESLSELLESRGHEAFYAPSYDAAEWVLSVHPFDVAFLDFDMPRLKGTVVARKLRERFPGLRPVILSACLSEALRQATEEDMLFLAKPVSLEAVLDCLARFERERAGSALTLRALYALTRYERVPPGVPMDTRNEGSSRV